MLMSEKWYAAHLDMYWLYTNMYVYTWYKHIHRIGSDRWEFNVQGLKIKG